MDDVIATSHFLPRVYEFGLPGEGEVADQPVSSTCDEVTMPLRPRQPMPARVQD
ncbi:MAG: hypothetical protein PVJ86_11210 [Phycisphaerales bacterium]